jgi:hypothetical protein
MVGQGLAEDLIFPTGGFIRSFNCPRETFHANAHRSFRFVGLWRIRIFLTGNECGKNDI